MSPTTSFYITNRSDYDSVVLFRHFRQILAATQTDAIQQFCTVAASKPGTELHYFGLLWDCAFKAGIAPTGVHSKSTTPPPPVVLASPPPSSHTRNFLPQRFLTNRSDYNSFVLFRHIRQFLAAAQTEAVKTFCTDAASKPGTEFHYLGLLWNCAFKAGIASTGTHFEPTSNPPISVAASSPQEISPPLRSFTRDFSVLQSSSPKPFGSLQHRFRRQSKTEKQSAPVLIPLLRAESVSLPFESLQTCPASIPSPQPPYHTRVLSSEPPHPTRIPLSQPPFPARVLSPQIPQNCDQPSPPPTIMPIFLSASDTPPSKIDMNGMRTSRSFMQRPLWFSLKPKIPRWIQARATLHCDDSRAGFSRP